MSRELSKKNKYYIPLYRRKELEYYCRQYDDYIFWLRSCQNLMPTSRSYIDLTIDYGRPKPDLSDVVLAGMHKRAKIHHRVENIETGLERIRCLHNLDIREQILHGVPSDGSSEMRTAIQRFYWYLDQQESYL